MIFDLDLYSSLQLLIVMRKTLKTFNGLNFTWATRNSHWLHSTWAKRDVIHAAGRERAGLRRPLEGVVGSLHLGTLLAGGFAVATAMGDGGVYVAPAADPEKIPVWPLPLRLSR